MGHGAVWDQHDGGDPPGDAGSHGPQNEPPEPIAVVLANALRLGIVMDQIQAQDGDDADQEKPDDQDRMGGEGPEDGHQKKRGGQGAGDTDPRLVVQQCELFVAKLQRLLFPSHVQSLHERVAGAAITEHVWFPPSAACAWSRYFPSTSPYADSGGLLSIGRLSTPSAAAQPALDAGQVAPAP